MSSCGGHESDGDADTPALASIEVIPATLDLTQGQTGQLSATPRDAAGNLLVNVIPTWSSSDTGVANVNQQGLVTAVNPGGAIVTAASGGQSGSAQITVTSVPVNNASLVIEVEPEDAQVTVTGPSGLPWISRGNVDLANLEPGAYRIDVHRVRYQGASENTSLDSGSSVRIGIMLQPELPQPSSISVPLRVSRLNPRYFERQDGTVVLLTGSHTWNNLVDMGADYPPPQFDFARYLDFLQEDGHNFTRIWAWEVPFPQSSLYERRQAAVPQPWPRVGPELDSSGHPRFDLSLVDESYLVRLRERVRLAQARNIYVSVMLFEGWAIQFSPGKASHPFNTGNNINSISPGTDLISIHTLRHAEILAIQQAYVSQVVTALNDLNNVLYEIVNEAGTYSTDWQSTMTAEVKRLENQLPNRHPVGMTFQYPGGKNETLLEADVEWISPGNTTQEDYLGSPPAATGSKVVLLDTDHLGGSGVGDADWVWKSFVRGMNPIYMDRYVPPDGVTDQLRSEAPEIRRAMGNILRLTERIDLANLVPREDLCSSGYCLAKPDANSAEYVVVVPGGGEVEVDLTGSPSSLTVEWLNPITGASTPGGMIAGGSHRTFSAPFGGSAVLHLYQ